MPLAFDPRRTALVTIDLQNGILSMPMQPYSADQITTRCRALAEAFRAHGALVIYVRVDLADMLPLLVDQSHSGEGSALPPPEASELSPASGVQPGDLRITKRHWGALGDTGLKEALTQHGIDTVVLAGVATNIGVESTARQAASLGLHVVVAEDACSTLGKEMHEFAMNTIFPMLGRVRTTQEIVDAFA